MFDNLEVLSLDFQEGDEGSMRHEQSGLNENKPTDNHKVIFDTLEKHVFLLEIWHGLPIPEYGSILLSQVNFFHFLVITGN